MVSLYSCQLAYIIHVQTHSLTYMCMSSEKQSKLVTQTLIRFSNHPNVSYLTIADIFIFKHKIWCNRLILYGTCIIYIRSAMYGARGYLFYYTLGIVYVFAGFQFTIQLHAHTEQNRKISIALLVKQDCTAYWIYVYKQFEAI